MAADDFSKATPPRVSAEGSGDGPRNICKCDAVVFVRELIVGDVADRVHASTTFPGIYPPVIADLPPGRPLLRPSAERIEACRKSQNKTPLAVSIVDYHNIVLLGFHCGKLLCGLKSDQTLR